jgi:hypothetical protein
MNLKASGWMKQNVEILIKNSHVQISSRSLFLRSRNGGLVVRFQVFILIGVILESPRSEKRKFPIVSDSKALSDGIES